MACAHELTAEQHEAEIQSKRPQDDSVQDDMVYEEDRHDYIVPAKPAHNATDEDDASLGAARPLSAGTSYSFDDTEEGQDIARLVHSKPPYVQYEATLGANTPSRANPAERTAPKSRSTLCGTFKPRDLHSSKTTFNHRRPYASAQTATRPAHAANISATQVPSKSSKASPSSRPDNRRVNMLPLRGVQGSRVAKTSAGQATQAASHALKETMVDAATKPPSQHPSTKLVLMTPVSRQPTALADNAHADTITVPSEAPALRLQPTPQRQPLIQARVPPDNELALCLPHLDIIANETELGKANSHDFVASNHDDQHASSSGFLPNKQIPTVAPCDAMSEHDSVSETPTPAIPSDGHGTHSPSRTSQNARRMIAAEVEAIADEGPPPPINAESAKTATQSVPLGNDSLAPVPHIASAKTDGTRPHSGLETGISLSKPEPPCVQARSQPESIHALVDMFVRKMKEENLLTARSIQAEQERRLLSLETTIRDSVQIVALHPANKLHVEVVAAPQAPEVSHEMWRAISALQTDMQKREKRQVDSGSFSRLDIDVGRAYLPDHQTIQALVDEYEKRKKASTPVELAAPQCLEAQSVQLTKSDHEIIARFVQEAMSPVQASLAELVAKQDIVVSRQRAEESPKLVAAPLEKMQQDADVLQAEYEAKLKSYEEEQQKLARKSLVDAIDKFNQRLKLHEKEKAGLVKERNDAAEKLTIANDLLSATRSELSSAGRSNDDRQRLLGREVDVLPLESQKKNEKAHDYNAASFMLRDEMSLSELQSLVDRVRKDNTASIGQVNAQDALIAQLNARIKKLKQVPAVELSKDTPTVDQSAVAPRGRSTVDRRTNIISETSQRSRPPISPVLKDQTLPFEDERLSADQGLLPGERPVSVSSDIDELLEARSHCPTPLPAQSRVECLSQNHGGNLGIGSQAAASGIVVEELPRVHPSSPDAREIESQESRFTAFTTPAVRLSQTRQDFPMSDHSSQDRGTGYRESAKGMLHSSRFTRQATRPNSSSKRVPQGSQPHSDAINSQQIEVANSSSASRRATGQHFDMPGVGPGFVPSTPQAAQQKRSSAFSHSPPSKRIARPSSPALSQVMPSSVCPVSRPVSRISDLPEPPQPAKKNKKTSAARKPKIITNVQSTHFTRSTSTGPSQTYYQLH